MSKSILVIDTPCVCCECPMCRNEECILLVKDIDEGLLDEDCPLNEAPKYFEVENIKPTDDVLTMIKKAEEYGYNLCLKDVLGDYD